MEVIKSIGDHRRLAEQMFIANDLDNAVAIAANDRSKQFFDGQLQDRPERFDSIPFTSENKYFASLNYYDDRNNIIYVNGAPEMLLDWCNIDDHTKFIHAHEIKEYTSIGYRIVGYAQKLVSKDKTHLSEGDVRE
ncbi:MAG: hypothetical protein H6765_00625 [Candidatus Peribacteria bacterium]|nr:MAG: hypothetical protein H6765_00625 [Candidatus Peribacteria bacterium]